MLTLNNNLVSNIYVIRHKGGENIRKQKNESKIFIALLLFSLTLLFLVSTVSASSEVYVNTTGNDSWSGTSDNP